jgi:hypothetical protein
MSRLGKRIIKSLEQFNRDLKAGKPMKQTVVRRMTVKGKTEYGSAEVRNDTLSGSEAESEGES